jgi:hypothetical protein
MNARGIAPLYDWQSFRGQGKPGLQSMRPTICFVETMGLVYQPFLQGGGI